MALPTPAAPLMTQDEVVAFLTALSGLYPEAASELDFADPYTLLVAVVLSAQTTDTAVNRVGRTLFAEAPHPAAMVALGEEGVARHIRSIGLWRAKARNVVALSQLLIERHEGQVPGEREALEVLPGVGRKTANVVLSIAFGQDVMAVDTHVFRLGNRTGLAPGRTPRAVEDALVERVPRPWLRIAHHWIILHGRRVCTARRPECWRCTAAEPCRYPAKTPPPAAAQRLPRRGVVSKEG
jgi:endonuclease-3